MVFIYWVRLMIGFIGMCYWVWINWVVFLVVVNFGLNVGICCLLLIVIFLKRNDVCMCNRFNWVFS